MTVPNSNPVRASVIRTELKASGVWKIGSAVSRKLAKKPSGLIKFSDFKGKSNILEFKTVVIKLPFGSQIKIPNVEFNGVNREIQMIIGGLASVTVVDAANNHIVPRGAVTTAHVTIDGRTFDGPPLNNVNYKDAHWSPPFNRPLMNYLATKAGQPVTVVVKFS